MPLIAFALLMKEVDSPNCFVSIRQLDLCEYPVYVCNLFIGVICSLVYFMFIILEGLVRKRYSSTVRP